MKRIITIVGAILCLLVQTSLVWGQASTEGKDFWVSSTICTMPPPSSGSPKATVPYIAISAQEACTVTITNVSGTVNITTNLAAGTWKEFSETTTPSLTASAWYPDQIMRSDDVKSLANQTNNYGLHITATKNVSVYVILRAENSMDASNILPITAIQSDYMITDYTPEAHGTTNQPVSMATILATENNTQIDIIPTSQPAGKQNANPFTITLNKGQTYYLMSQDGQPLGGTRINARNGKKIAVFLGSAIIRIPNGISARDCIFEQAMPIDYWGTQFVVTRSLEKDGNYVGITASEDGTEVKFDGYPVTYINAGETYYICMQGPNNPSAKRVDSNHPLSPSQILNTDVLYIETSCPCAIINYDTGNSFSNSSNPTEIQTRNKDLGDPSSVWISPVEQKINRITFGACYTNLTEDHFLNIVAETANCQQTTLTAYNSGVAADWTNRIQWIQVPGNKKYSYARVKIGTQTPDIKVFTLDNPAGGFIAHIYGNGQNESYAYSAGSAAVKRGVNVEGMTYTEGNVAEKKYCLGTAIHFDAQVGNDVVDKVDWDFGDGVGYNNSTPQYDYTYDAPGWYDITANIYAHKDCPETTYPAEAVHFRILVGRADTIVRKFSSCENDLPFRYGGKEYTADKTDTIAFACDSVVVFQFHVVPNTDTTLHITAKDQYNYHGKQYTATGIYTQHLTNMGGCDSIVTLDLKILTSLEMYIDNAQEHICPGEQLNIPYRWVKGEADEIRFLYGDNVLKLVDTLDVRNAEKLLLPTEKLLPGTYAAKIEVHDQVGDTTLLFPYDITVNYDSLIFQQKFGNILSVYSPAFNGNYVFSSYQWFCNGMPIPGATSSIYHTTDSLKLGDQYFVMLTRAGEDIAIPSCVQTIVENPIIRGHNAPAREAEKTVQNGRLLIRREEHLYDIYGNRVQ